MLHRTEELSRSAQPQILLRETKAVARLLDHAQPLRPRGLPPRNEDAVGRITAAPHAAAQLMQLCQSEPLRVLDHENRRVRYIDAHLDHGRRHEQLDLPCVEAAHHRLLIRRL